MFQAFGKRGMSYTDCMREMNEPIKLISTALREERVQAVGMDASRPLELLTLHLTPFISHIPFALVFCESHTHLYIRSSIACRKAIQRNPAS